jgi:hypothetical protein
VPSEQAEARLPRSPLQGPMQMPEGQGLPVLLTGHERASHVSVPHERHGKRLRIPREVFDAHRQSAQREPPSLALPPDLVRRPCTAAAIPPKASDAPEGNWLHEAYPAALGQGLAHGRTSTERRGAWALEVVRHARPLIRADPNHGRLYRSSGGTSYIISDAAGSRCLAASTLEADAWGSCTSFSIQEIIMLLRCHGLHESCYWLRCWLALVDVVIENCTTDPMTVWFPREPVEHYEPRPLLSAKYAVHQAPDGW